MKVYKLEQFSEDELCEIYHELNGYRWSDKLGEKPQGWDEMKNYQTISRIRSNVDRSINKSVIVRPILRRICELVPWSTILRHYHINNMGMTEEEIEAFWERNRELALKSSEIEVRIAFVFIGLVALGGIILIIALARL